ncbi:FAR1-related sequence 5-like protein [Tanacetum coccineum]
MVFIHEHQGHVMGVSEMVPDHDRVDSSKWARDQILESLSMWDEQDDNQIVLIPEHLQHTDDSDEFPPTPNGTPYWVPDVPEDEKPKKGLLFNSYNDANEAYLVYSHKARSKEVNTLSEVVVEGGENSTSKKRKRYSPTRAHRLKAALVGGYDKVRGTSTDYYNFKRCVNSFIGDRDAQMLVDKMCKRKLHVPEFCFEYHTLHSKGLVRLFWAGETMKCNYVAFGDVVSLDATFHTNKYGYKFVPFTGIDHNQRCVTFGAALLSDETTESFSWMLEAFLKTHKKQPPFAVTDQDGALRKAVVKMFPDSHHRLCMWHITEKLPGKVLGDLAADTNFRKDFHKLVWNVYIGPDVFEQRWNDMISRYNLHDNKWLSDMYAIRDRWVPGYFKEVHMCGLMKITSRSKSSNLFFQGQRSNTVIDVRIDKIPDAYLNRRWTKNVLAAHLLDKRHRYGPCIKETDKTQTLNVKPNKEALYADLLGVIVPDKVVIKTPRSIFRSKGTRRMKSAAEIGKAKTIARTNKKVPFKQRTCSTCGGKGHNKVTCKGCSACGEAGHHKGICKKFWNQDNEDEVDDEDEGDNEDEVDKDEVDNEDEVDDEDDVDEEYESEEE